MIEPRHKRIRISRQCELIGLPRASYYYAPKGDDPYNQQMMNRIDEEFTKRPFYGVPRMTAWLRRQGHEVNPKRIRRLMRRMGLEAIYPKKKLSKGHPAHKKYPYLLRGLDIERPNQVWAADITYVSLPRGFMYLVAVMDWFSRYVLAWELTNSMETDFCLRALNRALMRGRPSISNTDQGSQFTSEAYTDRLKEAGVRISMDGRGRALDNVFIERLWRSVKYEEVYLSDYANGLDAHRGLDRYFRFYNTERRHQSLEKRTPHEVHFDAQVAAEVYRHQQESEVPPVFDTSV